MIKNKGKDKPMSKIKGQEFHRRSCSCPINISRNVPISDNQKKSSVFMCIFMRVPLHVCVCVCEKDRERLRKKCNLSNLTHIK